MNGEIRYFITIGTALFFLLFSATGEAGIVLSTKSSGDRPLESLKYIINNSISLELKSAGFSVFFSDLPEAESLERLAEDRRASYIIRNIYRFGGGVLELETSCIRTLGGAGIYTSRESVEIDLDLDRTLGEIGEKIASAIKADIAGHPEFLLSPDNLSPSEKTEEEAVPSEEISGEVKVSGIGAADSVPAGPAKILKPLSVSAGFSPLLATGIASDYFKVAFVPSITGTYRFKSSFGYFGIGIYVSPAYFEATGLLVSSDNLLISFGPDLKLGIDINRYLSLIFKVNGGASLFMINRNNEGYRQTIIPFFSAGLGLSVDIVPLFGISVEADYGFFVDSSLLISGFMPAVGIHFNL